MKRVLPFIVIAIMIGACNQQTSSTPVITTDPVVAIANIDSLITIWTNKWSNHDSAGVINMFATDALLIDDNLVANNKAEIANKWIHPNINVVSNFKTTRLQDWSGNDRAGYTGKYEFDVVVKDSVVAKPHGFYTLNWIKTENGEWKITTAAIHAFVEKK